MESPKKMGGGYLWGGLAKWGVFHDFPHFFGWTKDKVCLLVLGGYTN